MKNIFTGETNNYILQDKLDSRLFLKNIDEHKNYPIFTANVGVATVYDKEAADIYASVYNLIKIRKY